MNTQTHITVWHLGEGYPNLTVPRESSYARLKPYCPRCWRNHCHEPSIVVDNVVGCIECFPEHKPVKYVGKHPRDIPQPRAVQPLMPDHLTAQHALHTLGSCDDEHLEWIDQLPPPPPEHVGKIGDRMEFTETCTRLESLGIGDYGERFIVVFGAALVWYTGESCWARVGERRTFKATVKDHTYYNGQPQTILTRCQLPREKKDAQAAEAICTATEADIY